MFQSLVSLQLARLEAATAVHHNVCGFVPSYSVPRVFAWPLGEMQFLHGLHFQLVKRSRSLLMQGLGTTFSTMQRLPFRDFWGCRASKRPVYGPTHTLTHTQEVLS